MAGSFLDPKPTEVDGRPQHCDSGSVVSMVHNEESLESTLGSARLA